MGPPEEPQPEHPAAMSESHEQPEVQPQPILRRSGSGETVGLRRIILNILISTFQYISRSVGDCCIATIEYRLYNYRDQSKGLPQKRCIIHFTNFSGEANIKITL